MSNPKQRAALKKAQKKMVLGTEAALRQALDRLVNKEAIRTDGRLTYSNLYKEADISRATLERYPKFKTELDKAKSFSGKNKQSPDSIFDKNKELMEANKNLHKELVVINKKYTLLQKKSKQEVYLLNTSIESLKKQLKREAKNNKTGLRVVK